ncbi:MAG: hypothetical protein LKE51_05850 [Selenomonas sp.]|nr:hypothetical protein [Selenomonas sp.]
MPGRWLINRQNQIIQGKKLVSGSTVQQQASVLLLAATTEDPHSSLLQTFTRRIPMTIALPALRQRSFAERYQLICTFLYLR